MPSGKGIKELKAVCFIQLYSSALPPSAPGPQSSSEVREQGGNQELWNPHVPISTGGGSVSAPRSSSRGEKGVQHWEKGGKCAEGPFGFTLLLPRAAEAPALTPPSTSRLWCAQYFWGNTPPLWKERELRKQLSTRGRCSC